MCHAFPLKGQALMTFPYPSVYFHNTNNNVAQPVSLQADATVGPSMV